MRIFLLFFILFSIDCSSICCKGKTTISFGCVAEERTALLKFKKSLSDPSNTLSSWNHTDCCVWKAVTCDNVTGHVVMLDLRSAFEAELASEAVDSSLLELKYLNYLDLSFNNFRLSPIPAFLGSMKELMYLYLAGSNFSGVVPHSLGNLTSLRVLDLRMAGEVEVDDLMWASNLVFLEHLDLRYITLGRTIDLVTVLSMLPSLIDLRIHSINTNFQASMNSSTLSNLRYLDLSWNSIHGEFPSFILNLTSLRFLDLSRNALSGFLPASLGQLSTLTELDLSNNYILSGPIPASLGNLSSLTRLDLSCNALSGPIPTSFGKLSSLKQLDFSYNGLMNGHIPASLGKLSALTVLDLSYNSFSGPIPTSFGELSALVELDLSYNSFNGPIPESLGKMSALTNLDISHNNFSGPIPSSIGNLRSLTLLSIENNQLSGEIPVSLGQLLNIVRIDMSSNSLNGTLSEAHFAKLSNLEQFSVGANELKFKVEFGWVAPFRLERLSLRSIKMEDRQFPKWIQTQKNITYLDLSDSGILGSLPTWLHYFDLDHLNLSHNHLVGSIPKLPSNLTHLDLSNNMMNGSIPNSLCRMMYLSILDFARNHLSGGLPDCWSNLQHLAVLRLSSNQISGIIPNSIGEASSLRWLHLNNNSLMGQLPFALRKCTNLFVLDVGENKLTGSLPEWIGSSLVNLNVLRLRNNEFYGEMSVEFCELPYLRIMDIANNKLTGKIPNCLRYLASKVTTRVTVDFESGESLMQVIKGLELEYKVSILKLMFSLDLSNNNLEGEIPSELTNLSPLINLNLSHNYLEGKIPSNIGDLKSLESLDLSWNHLFGTIPQSLSYLSYLSVLNLSHNNLSGQIPTGNQLQTLDDPSIYAGNPGLCGSLLQHNCPNSELSKSQDGKVGRGKEENIYFYGVVACGFIAGFWGFIGVLVWKRTWRYAYFHYIEVAIERVLRF